MSRDCKKSATKESRGPISVLCGGMLGLAWPSIRMTNVPLKAPTWNLGTFATWGVINVPRYR